jgi:hypothetical protein
MKIQWWAYIHSNGTLQLKRYFGREDINEAIESPFCGKIYGPFDADNREDALAIAKKGLGMEDD